MKKLRHCHPCDDNSPKALKFPVEWMSPPRIGYPCCYKDNEKRGPVADTSCTSGTFSQKVSKWPEFMSTDSDSVRAGAQPRFQSWWVQFLGLGYCTEQNTDGIPRLVHCRLLRNGNHTLHQKSWGGPSKFWGIRTPPDPPVVAPLASVNVKPLFDLGTFFVCVQY